MATTYENEFSNFPQEKIKLHNFKNIDDTIAPVIEQIKTLRAKGLNDLAQETIDANADILSQYVIDAITIRTLEEEIYNTQAYAKYVNSKYQHVHLGPEEPEAEVNDVWIGGE